MRSLNFHSSLNTPHLNVFLAVAHADLPDFFVPAVKRNPIIIHVPEVEILVRFAEVDRIKVNLSVRKGRTSESEQTSHFLYPDLRKQIAVIFCANQLGPAGHHASCSRCDPAAESFEEILSPIQ